MKYIIPRLAALAICSVIPTAPDRSAFTLPRIML